MNVNSRLNEWHPEMTAWRRELHAHPQTAFEEKFASDFIAAKLQAWGIETHRGLAKTGVVGMTRYMAVEWAEHNIQVNAIAPGWIETPMTATMQAGRRKWVEDHVPQHRYGLPKDIGDLAVYLASPAADYVTGQTFPVDGGFIAGNPWPPLDPS